MLEEALKTPFAITTGQFPPTSVEEVAGAMELSVTTWVLEPGVELRRSRVLERRANDEWAMQKFGPAIGGNEKKCGRAT